MTKTAPKTWSTAFTSLVIPLAIGLGLYLCLNLMIDREVITGEALLRYLTGHPISKITTFFFCVGVAALLLIANNIFDQFCNCDKIKLECGKLTSSDRSEASGLACDDSIVSQTTGMMDQLLEYRPSVRSHYLWNRLFGALGFISRTGSPSGIEDELKYLADMDYDRQQRRYSLVRIVIWATPMLGFLGTVLGISQALGGIQVGPENDFQGMLNGLRGSLYVAFDTTALALTLSIVLMFFQFFIDKFELQLLDAVQRRANEELSPLYQSSAFLDPQTRAIEKIGRSVLVTSQNLIKQQTDQWQVSMKSAELAWVDSISDISETVRSNLSESLRLANIELANSISGGIDRADESMAKRWEQWQVLLSENARQLSDNQAQTVAQVELMKQLLEKIESVNGAQQMLGSNLDALAATSQMQATLQSLAGSIHEIRQKGTSNAVVRRAGLRIHRQSKTNDEIELSRANNIHRAKRNAA